MTTTNRRWLRFSLRTMFVVVTVCALLSPSIAEQVHEWQRRHTSQCAVIEALEQVKLPVLLFPGDRPLSMPSEEQWDQIAERRR